MEQTTHPMQRLVVVDGVVRFRSNKIVEYMLNAGREAGLFDLNTLALMPFDDEDRAQLAQLIGYSLSGWGDLSYVSDELWDEATMLAQTL